MEIRWATEDEINNDYINMRGNVCNIPTMQFRPEFPEIHCQQLIWAHWLRIHVGIHENLKIMH